MRVLKKFFLNAAVVVVAIFLLLTASLVVYALVRPNTQHNLDYYGSEPFKGYAAIRTATALTASYVDTEIVDVKTYSRMGLLFDIVQASLVSFEYRIWISYDNVNWFVEATETIAAGTITDTAANYTIALAADVKYYKILPVYAKYIKLDVKGTGALVGNTCAVYLLGVQ